GRQVYSGNSGKSTGPHVHVHDVLADGVTRARPFSTITETTQQEEDSMEKPIVVERVGGDPEAMVMAPWLTGDSALEQGYYLVTSGAAIAAASRAYGKGDGVPQVRVDRAGYIQIQELARVMRTKW